MTRAMAVIAMTWSGCVGPVHGPDLSECRAVGAPETMVERRSFAIDLGPRVLDGTRLVGSPAELVVEVDPRERAVFTIVERASDPELVSYDLVASDGSRLCDDGGIVVGGVWDESGARFDALGEYEATYACVDDPIAQCIAWGYAPWTVGADVHQTCTRMARADYCGDGRVHADASAPFAVFDELGVHSASDASGMIFEAAWGPDGALCVNHSRSDDRVLEMGVVRPWCWGTFARCASLQQAGPHGALLANASIQVERVFDCGL